MNEPTENAECPACEGDGRVWCGCDICNATVGDRCGHCGGTGKRAATPENVDTPGGQQ